MRLIRSQVGVKSVGNSSPRPLSLTVRYTASWYTASSSVHTAMTHIALWNVEDLTLCRQSAYRWPPLWSSGQSSWLQNGDVLCFPWATNWICICYVDGSRPHLSSSVQSSWLQIQRPRGWFPALPDFLRGSGSVTGSTQLRKYNWGATWKEKVAAPV
jgi:hypothetical protein